MRSAPHTVARQGHLLRIDPGFTIHGYFSRLDVRDTRATLQCEAGLRLAGLPES